MEIRHPKAAPMLPLKASNWFDLAYFPISGCGVDVPISIGRYR
jgi:hypothetical protein